jgi:hypothetical protein
LQQLWNWTVDFGELPKDSPHIFANGGSEWKDVPTVNEGENES